MARQRSTWKTAAGAVAVAGVALLSAAPPALAQDGGGGPDPTGASVQEQVSARVLPAVDRLRTDVGGGWLVNPATLDAYPVQATVSGCTGFTLSADGYIGTAGHCVDPTLIEDDARVQVANSMAQTTGVDADALYQELRSWVVTSSLDQQVPLSLTVSVAPSTAAPDDPALAARVVDLQPFSKGDTALLKVDATNLLTVPTGPNELAAVGTPVIAIGYPVAREQAVDPSLVPTWMEGAVSSQQSKDGIAYTEISATMGHGMSGGPTVDQQGRVLGINSQFGQDGSGDRFSYVVPVSRMNEMMVRDRVNTAPGPVDTEFRAGLDDYFRGHYTDAVADADRVLAVAPGTRAAQDLKTKAAQAHERFGDSGFSLGTLGPKAWGFLGGIVLLVLAFLGTLVGSLRRRRHGPATPGPVGAGPVVPVVPGPRGPGYAPPMPPVDPRMVGHPAVAPGGDARAAVAGPPSPPVGFPTVAASPSAATTVVARPSGGGTVAPERPRLAAGFCPRCGAARTPGARFCGNCGADGH